MRLDSGRSCHPFANHGLFYRPSHNYENNVLTAVSAAAAAASPPLLHVSLLAAAAAHSQSAKISRYIISLSAISVFLSPSTKKRPTLWSATLVPEWGLWGVRRRPAHGALVYRSLDLREPWRGSGATFPIYALTTRARPARIMPFRMGRAYLTRTEPWRLPRLGLLATTDST